MIQDHVKIIMMLTNHQMMMDWLNMNKTKTRLAHTGGCAGLEGMVVM